MNIQEMSRKQFDLVPTLRDSIITDFDSIVLLPTRRHCDNGWNLMSIVLCKGSEPIGKLYYYDVVRFWELKIGGIDCLYKSALMRIHFEPNEYVCDTSMHTLYRKEYYENYCGGIK